jgi:hypothetical protein
MPDSNPKKTMKCGETRKSTRAGKKIMHLYCLKNGKKKLVHAGSTGYGNNYSAAARKNFKARHHCSSAKPGTARHLACTELWRKGGRTTSNPRGRSHGKY